MGNKSFEHRVDTLANQALFFFYGLDGKLNISNLPVYCKIVKNTKIKNILDLICNAIDTNDKTQSKILIIFRL